jgi:hypothetical protein
MKTTVLCLECNEEVGILTNGAHFKLHGMTVAEYKLKYPGAPLISERTRASRQIPFDKDEIEKIRASCKLVVKTPEWNQRNSEGQKGKVIAEDSKVLMSASAKIRMARDGNPMDRPEVAAKHAATVATERYKRSLAEGQAKGYLNHHNNGLNQLFETHLQASNVSRYIREFMFSDRSPYRYDFGWPDLEVVVEVAGCRYHRCEQHLVWGDFPQKATNIQLGRDKAKATYAKNKGWKLIVIWEHEILDSATWNRPPTIGQTWPTAQFQTLLKLIGQNQNEP